MCTSLYKLQSILNTVPFEGDPIPLYLFLISGEIDPNFSPTSSRPIGSTGLVVMVCQATSDRYGKQVLDKSVSPGDQSIGLNVSAKAAHWRL